MPTVMVLNLHWIVRILTDVGLGLWTALPGEITATAVAHPSRALLTLGVVGLLSARLVMACSGATVLVAAKIVLATAGLALLLEFEAFILAAGCFSHLNIDLRRGTLEI